jgi:hypothetical protein
MWGEGKINRFRGQSETQDKGAGRTTHPRGFPFREINFTKKQKEDRLEGWAGK